MKTLSIEHGMRALTKLLSQENGKSVVYLTRKGRPKFALVPLDEGDQEVLAMRENKKLMAYLDECSQRALQEPRKTLAEIKAQFGIKTAEKKRKRSNRRA